MQNNVFQIIPVGSDVSENMIALYLDPSKKKLKASYFMFLIKDNLINEHKFPNKIGSTVFRASVKMESGGLSW